MLFNSLTYFIFFAIVLGCYFQLSHRWQNRMLLVASYVFYGWWDWRFLSLIFISTLTDYVCGIIIFRELSSEGKKRFLYFSIFINLSLLGFFKYYGFFIDSFASVLGNLGINAALPTLHIILPVGISFYTFQTMTYSIDIYRGELEPTNNFLDFALFVSFFPQLVAGPIERARNLLPQIQNKRHFNKEQMIRGCYLIFWGLFLKVFVADNLGIIVDKIYANPASSGAEYVIATWAFAFQIYGDFSGYTDIARGSSKCLGIELMHNFNQPYFATNPSDLWRRWHISLSSWLKDYLYIPLGGNRRGKFRTYMNLFLTMLLGGLWHGAAWKFVIWGAYHGIILAIHRIFFRGREKACAKSLFQYFLRAFLMFQLTCLGWIFFRAQSAKHIMTILGQIGSFSWKWKTINGSFLEVMFFAAVPFLAMLNGILKERRPGWFSDGCLLRFCEIYNLPAVGRATIYAILSYLLFFHGARAHSFIYFQF